LHSVADAQYRHAECKDGLGSPGWLGIGHGFGTSRKDDAPGAERPNFVIRNVPGVDLAIHTQLAHAPGEQLRIVGAEVEDQDPMRMDVRKPGSWGLLW